MSIINSERLFFRQLTKDDVSERYLSWLNDPEVNRYLETRHTKQTREKCESFVSDMEKDDASHFFGIFNREDSEHIGNIKLGPINSHHLSGQLSLFIGDKTCWRRGYAAESIRCITEWGFEVLNLERIEAGCYETNIGSLRAFLKVGYSVEGFFRKSIVSNEERIGGFWLGILRSESIE